MACAICRLRRPKRFCPGVHGDICSICCGQEREVSVTCPLDCEYLQDARLHDKPVPLDADALPNRDIRVTENLLEQNEALLTFLDNALLQSALETPGVTDFDIREALASLIQTCRTLQSGLYYESRPANSLANGIFGSVQRAIAQFREDEQKQLGMTKTRDSDILALLVFLQHLELDRNNGRPRSRAFIHLLLSLQAATAPEPSASRLVLP